MMSEDWDPPHTVSSVISSHDWSCLIQNSRLEHDVRNEGHRTTNDHGLPYVQCKRSLPSQSAGHAPKPSRVKLTSATPGPKCFFQIAACIATFTGDCLNVRTPCRRDVSSDGTDTTMNNANRLKTSWHHSDVSFAVCMLPLHATNTRR